MELDLVLLSVKSQLWYDEYKRPESCETIQSCKFQIEWICEKTRYDYHKSLKIWKNAGKDNLNLNESVTKNLNLTNDMKVQVYNIVQSTMTLHYF